MVTERPWSPPMQSMATQTSVGDDTAEEIRRAPLLGQALLRDAAVGYAAAFTLTTFLPR